MGRIRSFWTLPWRTRIFLLKTAVLLAFIRLSLWVLPFQTLRQLLGKFSQSPAFSTTNLHTVTHIVQAVRVTSRYVPQASCLTQALAAQVMLSRRGIAADLRLGVLKNEQGALEAHAWLESDGRVLIGGEDALSRFVPLPPLKGKHR